MERNLKKKFIVSQDEGKGSLRSPVDVEIGQLASGERGEAVITRA